MAETVLVTGGTGYVASWCIAALLERGYAVRATVRSRAKEPAVRAAVRRAGATDASLQVVEADLTAETGWDTAMAGCTYVLHVASPLGGAGLKEERDWITPAREGTLRVLSAAVAAGVRRVVMTSAAATARPPLDSGRPSNETVWADPLDPQFDAYRRSKILAERAAWDFMAERGGTTTLTTILPGAVFGPLLSRDNTGSVGIIQRLLAGKPPGLPRLGFSVVDVRDLANLHVHAMTAPEAAGERFLATGEFVWFAQMAQTLRDRLGERAAKVPRRVLPDFAVRLAALFAPGMKGLLPLLGHTSTASHEKATRMLGFQPRPAAETVVDTASSLLDPAF